MGYTFIIGNAILKEDKSDFPRLNSYWEVQPEFSENAPWFPGEIEQQSNIRSPSYSAWKQFCENTSLYEFFYDERGHLEMGHPGCVGITQPDVDIVSTALKHYKRYKKTGLPPGFEDFGACYENQPPNYDCDLARLIWLEWWMRWAFENCETPAIQNY